MDDYDLSLYCPPFSMLYMVYHGWIQLSDVMTWRHARDLLGQALVYHMNYGKLSPTGKVALCDVFRPPTKEQVDAFQYGWQVGRDENKRYDWDKERDSRSRHGPFGPAAGRYAMRTTLERALRELQKPDVDIDKVKLPGNWKPLLGPLFRRAHTFRPTPVPEGVCRQSASNENRRESPKVPILEEQKEPKRKFRTTVEDADDEDDSEEPRRYTREEKGKWKPKVDRLDTETSFETQAAGCVPKPQVPVPEPSPSTFSSAQTVPSANASAGGPPVSSDNQALPSVNASTNGSWTSGNAPTSDSPATSNVQPVPAANASTPDARAIPSTQVSDHTSAALDVATKEQAGFSWQPQPQVSNQVGFETPLTNALPDMAMEGVIGIPNLFADFSIPPQANEQDSDMSVEYAEPPPQSTDFVSLKGGKRFKLDIAPELEMSAQPTMQPAMTPYPTQAFPPFAPGVQNPAASSEPSTASVPAEPRHPGRLVKPLPRRAQNAPVPQLTPLPADSRE